MKSNRSFLLLFVAQALILEGALAGLIFLNRDILEGVVSEFTSASEEGPEVAALLSSKHHDVAAYLQGWAGFHDIINQTASQTFSPDMRQQLHDTVHSLNISSISIIGANSLVLESSMGSAVGKPFPIDTLMDYFRNNSRHSRRCIVTTQSWTLAELEHLVPTDTNARVTLEPAVVKIMAAPVHEISDNQLIEGEVIGVIIGIDLVNGQSSLLESSLNLFNSGYFGIYAWNKFARQFQLLTSVYKQSSTDDAKFDVLLDGGGHDTLARGLSSSFSPKQLYEEEDVLINSRHHTVSIVPLVPLHEPAFDECTLHAYIVRGLDNSEWLQLLRSQSEIEASIMVVELITVALILILTYCPMNRFLVSLEKAFNVPSLSRDQRDKIDRHAASMMGLDTAGAKRASLTVAGLIQNQSSGTTQESVH